MIIKAGEERDNRNAVGAFMLKKHLRSNKSLFFNTCTGRGNLGRLAEACFP